MAENRDMFYTFKLFLNNFVSDEAQSEIINICLYPVEFTQIVSQKNSVIEFLRQFLRDVEKEVQKVKFSNINHIRNVLSISKSVLNIRETSNVIINYDNVFQHFPNADLSQQKLLQYVVQNQIKDDDTFRRVTNRVINHVQAYYEIISISYGLNDFEGFLDHISKNNTSVFETTKMYRDKVINLYNDLSKLQTVEKQESEKDYFIIKDKQSTTDLAQSLTTFITSNYSMFETGYDLFDINGFETGSLYVISAPSNHGKSILKANVTHKLLEKNIDNFDPEDGVMFLTLEDDYKKLTRRFCSIFGNYDQTAIKSLYTQGYECNSAIKNTNGDTANIQNKIFKMMDNVLKTSIYRKTQNKVNLIIRHVNENEFSPGDLSKFIDLLRVEGINIKMVFIDYLDCMIPTVQNPGKNGTYEEQGQITQELRNLTRHHNMPIVTASQNTRASENMQIGMSNSMIGDSYNKIRYSDFIYMARMNSTIDVFDDAVMASTFSSQHLNNPGKPNQQILKLKDQILEDLIPLEVKITKSKDAGKDKTQFMLFCKRNLRVYGNIQEYLDDMPKLVKNTSALEKDILLLQNLTISSASDDFDTEAIFG